MRKLFLTICLVAVAALVAQAAPALNTKLGKPTNEELQMTQLDTDPDAPAVYLARTAQVRYTFNKGDGLMVEYEYTTRLKVLKDEGVKYATETIIYHDNGDGLTALNERVTDIQCTTYNLNGNKTEKVKMDKKAVQREKIENKNVKLTFTAAGVKAGSVVEFKYKIQSGRLLEMRNWQQQLTVPVLYTQLDANMILFFQFHVAQRGNQAVDVKTEQNMLNYTVQGDYKATTTLVEATRVVYTTGALPATTDDLKADNVNAIDFTLGNVVLPWVTQRSDEGAQTWRDRSQASNYTRDFTDDVDNKVSAMRHENDL